jgi:malate dehydrogenase
MVKATILGAAGGIGQPLSLLLRLNPKIDDLSLFDIVNTPGVAADLSHIPTNQTIKGYVPLSKTDNESIKVALKGSDIVIIPAGIPRKPGMTRDDLFKINAGIVKNLVHQAGIACPNAFICIISNPVNSTVPIAVEELKRLGVYNPKKVFGITTLDNLRLEEFLSAALDNKVSSNDLYNDVITIGGHSGDSIVPVINSWIKNFVNDEEKYNNLIKRVQFGGDEVVKAKDGKGSATLSMATAAYRFVDNLLNAIVSDKSVKEVAFVKIEELPVANNIPYFITKNTQYFSLPIVINKNGIELVEFPESLSEKEVLMTKHAVEKVKVDVAKGFNFVHGSKL